MDTLRSRFISRRSAWLRRGRVLLFLGLIAVVQSTLAYMVLGLDWPRQPLFVSIRVGEYQAAPLAHRGRRVDALAAIDNVVQVGATRQEILQGIDRLARGGRGRPIVVSIRALAMCGNAGRLFLLPGDASLDDASTWLALADVLTKLRALPAQQKLLLLDLTPASPQLGNLYQDLATALEQELAAVPDSGRLALAASVDCDDAFAVALRDGLRGAADADHDGQISVRELAAFVPASLCQRFGAESEFALRTLDAAEPREQAAEAHRGYPDWLLEAWRARDAAFQAGQHRLTPRLFQQWQATLLALEEAWAGGCAEAMLRKRWLAECERLQEAMQRNTADLIAAPPGREELSPTVKKLFDERWRALQQQLTGLSPAEAERVRARLSAELRGQIAPADLDALVFAQTLADPRLDVETLRFHDRLLHPMAQATPRSAEGLRLRMLGDQASAWPADLVEAVLRCSANSEKAARQQPALPGFLALLDEPTAAQHTGEMRTSARGYANLGDATMRLATAAARFERLALLNQRWRVCENALADALADLPWYLDALEPLPAIRAAWGQAAESARQLADTLKIADDAKLSWDQRVERLTKSVEEATGYSRALQIHRQALHAPLRREALAKLQKKSPSPLADAILVQRAVALRGIASPALAAEERARLWNLLDGRANRSLAAHLDTADPGRRLYRRAAAQLTLLDLAGVSERSLRSLRQRLDGCQKNANDRAAWCELGAALRRASHTLLPKQYAQESAWGERERLAWLMPCLEKFAGVDDAPAAPTVERRRRDREQRAAWLYESGYGLADDYQRLNLDTPGINAARRFFAREVGSDMLANESAVRFHLVAAIEPLTKNHPYTDAILEVTRPVSTSPLELHVHRPDDAWLELTPASVSLPAPKGTGEARTLTQRVPLKITRNPHGERTGTPPPLGFLIEARVDGRCWHHVVAVPIVPDAQPVRILVSTDANGPATTVNDIRLRPGKARQPYYVYVKSRLPRKQSVHVEIAAGATLLHRTREPIVLDPDGTHKIAFDAPGVKLAALDGPLTLRVYDEARHKLLQERTLGIEILAPHEYVKVTDVAYAPGRPSTNKWTAQVQARRAIGGPAIAAQLVLPMERIPGLLGVGGGTLHADVPTRLTSARTLFAENIRLIHAADQEGPVYLHIDGVPRAFVYRTQFAHDGKPHDPQLDLRPAVRLTAPPCISAGVNLLVDAEIDNAPKGSRLQIALGRLLEDRSFHADEVREFTDAKKRVIGLVADKDALTFEAAITDWTATFDTRAVARARALDAKLTDSAGRVIASCRQSLVIDDSPPLARFLPTVAAVKKGSVLHLQAQAVDPESGVAQVQLFFGVPDNGEIPHGARHYKAIPASRDRSIWKAALLIPNDHKGPLQVSLYVANHAGLTSTDTISLEVTDHEPGTTGLGKIAGRVLEGARPQVNIVVKLTDENGKEIAATRTQRNGEYQFEQLKPGRYRVQCVKPESQRRAVLDVRIEPDRTAHGDLNLTL